MAELRLKIATLEAAEASRCAADLWVQSRMEAMLKITAYLAAKAGAPGALAAQWLREAMQRSEMHVLLGTTDTMIVALGMNLPEPPRLN